jgi:CrcB protein
VKPLLAVLAGGAVGTALRLGVDVVLPHGGTAFPVGTLLINIVGSFALAILVARVWPSVTAWVRAGLGPGLLGSFTTFSALAVSAVELTSEGVGLAAVIYIAVSVAGGLAAALLGLRLGASAGSATPPIGVDE